MRSDASLPLQQSTLPMLHETVFFGRSTELATLATLVGKVAQGEGGLVLIESESGGGKSRLLQEFRQTLSSNCRLLQGQACAHIAARPFEVLLGVIQGAVSLGRQEPEYAALLRYTLGERWPVLITRFPELQELSADSVPPSSLPDATGEEMSVRAIAAFLDALGTAEHPAFVLLDDFQWSDDLTARLLRFWQSHRTSRRCHTLVIVAYRQNELPAQSALRTVQPLCRIKLSVISPADLRTVVESIAGPISEATFELVRHLSLDNLFMATAIFRGLVETGSIEKKSQVWDIAQDVGAEQNPTQAGPIDFLRKRIELLNPALQQLLRVAAILGREFELNRLARVVDEPIDKIESQVADAISRRILVPGHNTRHLAFAHDRLRETVLAGFPLEQRRVVHAAIAKDLELSDSGLFFEIAFHYDAASMPRKALPYALLAAEKARKRHALQVAEVQYDIARRASYYVGEDVRYTVALGLGEVLLGRGKYEQAEVELRLARQTAREPLQKAAIDLKLGILNIALCNSAAAYEAINNGLELLLSPTPASTTQKAWSLLKNIVIHLAHVSAPKFFMQRLGPADETEQLRARLRLRAQYAAYFQVEFLGSIAILLENMNCLERFSPTAELSHQYACHSVFLSAIPLFRFIDYYGKRAIAIAQEYEDQWFLATAYHLYGVALLPASRFKDSLDTLLHSLRIFEPLGYRWEENMVRCNIGYALYRLGNLKEAVRECRKTCDDGMPLGDLQPVVPALSAWAKATSGLVPSELLDECENLAVRFDLQTKVELKQARAIWHLGRGDPNSAIVLLQDAWHMLRSRHFYQEYVVSAVPWLATAERMRIMQAGSATTRAMWKEARQAAKGALALAKRFKNNLPHAYRELGILAAMQGYLKQAQKHFQKSYHVAETQGARYELLQTLAAASRFKISIIAEDGSVLLVEQSDLLTRLKDLGANINFLGLTKQ